MALLPIRPLGATDVRAYKALRDEALRRTPEAFVADYASAVVRPAHDYAHRFGLVSSGTFFLGAFAPNGALVGCMGCERPLSVQQQHSASLVGLMVDPTWQRQGVGRSLLLACIAGAQSVCALERLTLSVTITPASAHVVRLYESAGFRAWGVLPRALIIHGVGYDNLHMIRLLHPTSFHA